MSHIKDILAVIPPKLPWCHWLAILSSWALCCTHYEHAICHTSSGRSTATWKNRRLIHLPLSHLAIWGPQFYLCPTSFSLSLTRFRTFPFPLSLPPLPRHIYTKPDPFFCFRNWSNHEHYFIQPHLHGIDEPNVLKATVHLELGSEALSARDRWENQVIGTKSTGNRASLWTTQFYFLTNVFSTQPLHLSLFLTIFLHWEEGFVGEM